jgi:hypothetical protein
MTTAEAIRLQPYQYLPQPSEKDYERLRDSIAEAGGLWPGHEVEVDENGVILDGYTRERACAELGLPCPRRVRTDLKSEDEKYDYIVKVNMARRHLTIEQKREITREYLRRFPERSDRAVAESVGLDHKTVGKQRDALEGSGEIPQTVRPHTRPAIRFEDEAADDPFAVERPEPTYRPDHKNSTVVTVIVNYPMASEVERERGALPYPREADRQEWETELVMQTDIPNSAFALDPFAVELANRFKAAVRQDPFLTMLK